MTSERYLEYNLSPHIAERTVNKCKRNNHINRQLVLQHPLYGCEKSPVDGWRMPWPRSLVSCWWVLCVVGNAAASSCCTSARLWESLRLPARSVGRFHSEPRLSALSHPADLCLANTTTLGHFTYKAFIHLSFVFKSLFLIHYLTYF